VFETSSCPNLDAFYNGDRQDADQILTKLVEEFGEDQIEMTRQDISERYGVKLDDSDISSYQLALSQMVLELKHVGFKTHKEDQRLESIQRQLTFL